jgi:integrase
MLRTLCKAIRHLVITNIVATNGLNTSVLPAPFDQLDLSGRPANKDGVKTKTINLSLETVRRILRLAAEEWRDKQGATWLEVAPKIKLFRITDARKPHSLSVEEEQFLFQQLSSHLLRVALYKANTGCRQEEVCALRWEWEKQMPEIGTSVFVVPGERVKNTEERIVVLNQDCEVGD